MADSAHIYSYRGTTRKKSYHILQGPCPRKLGCVLTILTAARRQPSCTAREGEGRGEAQNDPQCQGLLPPIVGWAQSLHPSFFLILGPGQLPQGGIWLTPYYSAMKIYCLHQQSCQLTLANTILCYHKSRKRLGKNNVGRRHTIPSCRFCTGN